MTRRNNRSRGGEAPDPGGGRIAYYDNLKFILIALVAIGHYIDPFREVFPAYARVYFFIYLFHMPLFMFVTGLFSKHAIGGGFTGSGGGRRPGFNARRVAGFFILYLLVNACIFAANRFAVGMDIEYNPLVVRNSSWYLLACGILTGACALGARCAGGRLRMGTAQKALVVLLLVAVAIAAGYFEDIDDFLALSRVICFAPFFVAGLYADPERIIRFIIAPHNRRSAATILIAAAVLAVVAAVVFLMPEQWLRLSGIVSARKPYEFISIVSGYGPLFRFLWYALASALCLCVMALVPLRRMFFSRVGRNTVAVYIWHPIALRFLYAASIVPGVTGIAGKPAAILIPAALALAAVFLFSFKPPFGIVARIIMDLKLPASRKTPSV